MTKVITKAAVSFALLQYIRIRANAFICAYYIGLYRRTKRRLVFTTVEEMKICIQYLKIDTGKSTQIVHYILQFFHIKIY